jgi:hypothetical protein
VATEFPTSRVLDQLIGEVLCGSLGGSFIPGDQVGVDVDSVDETAFIGVMVAFTGLVGSVTYPAVRPLIPPRERFIYLLA